MDYFTNRILLAVISGAIAYFAYRMNERAIKKGRYYQSRYSGKTTYWGFLFYFASILCLIGVCAVLGVLD